MTKEKRRIYQNIVWTKWNMWKALKCSMLGILGVFCVIYFVICVAYAGIGLSWIFIWPMFAVFCILRAIMLFRQISGKAKRKCPKSLGILYRLVFMAGMIIFVSVEAKVINAMNAVPESNLSYVIVLGAGVRGTTPTRPLLLRMKKAYEYMSENPHTILIASGGKGNGEDISEAECIYEYLVEKGIPSERILLEDQSTDTKENLKNSFAIIPQNAGRVGILSNGFHLYRATQIANLQGHTNVSGVAADTLLPLGIHYVVREFFAVVELIYDSV